MDSDNVFELEKFLYISLGIILGTIIGASFMMLISVPVNNYKRACAQLVDKNYQDKSIREIMYNSDSCLKLVEQLEKVK